MNKIAEVVFSSLVFPLLVAALAPMLAAAGSFVTTGDATALFDEIPWWLYSGVVILLLSWVGVILIRRRLRQIRDDGFHGGVYSSGDVQIGEVDYAGMKWKVFAYGGGYSQQLTHRDIDPSSVTAETPPLCPLCKTELHQEERFWGGFLISCVRCEFQKKARRSYHSEQIKASKLARSLFAEEQRRVIAEENQW